MVCNCKSRSKYPTNPLYFKEESVCEVIALDDEMQDIERILEIMVDPIIRNIDLIETMEGISNEGQHLTGYKVLVEVTFREKVLYVPAQCNQPVQGVHVEETKTFFIIIPKKIDGISVEELFEEGHIQAKPYIEKVYGRPLDTRTIQKCMMVFIDLVIN